MLSRAPTTAAVCTRLRPPGAADEDDALDAAATGVPNTSVPIVVVLLLLPSLPSVAAAEPSDDCDDVRCCRRVCA